MKFNNVKRNEVPTSSDKNVIKKRKFSPIRFPLNEELTGVKQSENAKVKRRRTLTWENQDKFREDKRDNDRRPNFVENVPRLKRKFNQSFVNYKDNSYHSKFYKRHREERHYRRQRNDNFKRATDVGNGKYQKVMSAERSHARHSNFARQRFNQAPSTFIPSANTNILSNERQYSRKTIQESYRRMKARRNVVTFKDDNTPTLVPGPLTPSLPEPIISHQSQLPCVSNFSGTLQEKLSNASDLPTVKDVNTSLNLKSNFAPSGPSYFKRLANQHRQRPYTLNKQLCTELATLVLKRIPKNQNNITLLHDYFSKFGTILNIAVNHEDDPEAALIKFSKNEEALSAYNCKSAILNNRFIKIFWHNKYKARTISSIKQKAQVSAFDEQYPTQSWQGMPFNVNSEKTKSPIKRKLPEDKLALNNMQKAGNDTTDLLKKNEHLRAQAQVPNLMPPSTLNWQVHQNCQSASWPIQTPRHLAKFDQRSKNLIIKCPFQTKPIVANVLKELGIGLTYENEKGLILTFQNIIDSQRAKRQIAQMLKGSKATVSWYTDSIDKSDSTTKERPPVTIESQNANETEATKIVPDSKKVNDEITPYVMAVQIDHSIEAVITAFGAMTFIDKDNDVTMSYDWDASATKDITNKAPTSDKEEKAFRISAEEPMYFLLQNGDVPTKNHPKEVSATHQEKNIPTKPTENWEDYILGDDCEEDIDISEINEDELLEDYNFFC